MDCKFPPYEPRSRTWTEDEIRLLLKETIRETRAHPKRPDGTYNWDGAAVIQHVLDEYYAPSEGWRSRLFDAVIGDGATSVLPSTDTADGSPGASDAPGSSASGA